MDRQALSEIGLRTERVQGPARMPDSHRNAEVEVNFIIRGRLSYWLGGGLVTLDPGSLSVFWAAYPHRVMADTADLEFYWLTVPLPQFLSWGFPRPLVDALMSGTLVRQDHVGSIPGEQLLWGLSLKDYLNRQRIAEAQRLLLSGDATVLQIAYQCGFASPSRFHEWFNRLCGTTPEQYRRQHAQGLPGSNPAG